MDQMTIFDFIGQKEHPELDKLDEAQMVAIVGRAVGLNFKWDDFFEDYRAKRGKDKYNIRYGVFSVEPYTRYISCGYDYGIGGCHSPEQSIEDAIAFFKRWSK